MVVRYDVSFTVSVYADGQLSEQEILDRAAELVGMDEAGWSITSEEGE